MRWMLAAGAVAIVLALVPDADAATRRATDREARIRFTLDDRVLTVRVLPRARAGVRRQLYGKSIRATCGTSFNFSRGVKVKSTRRWPRGRRTVRYRLRRNISRRVRWCLLEHRRGGDVAFATFSR